MVTTSDSYDDVLAMARRCHKNQASVQGPVVYVAGALASAASAHIKTKSTRLVFPLNSAKNPVTATLVHDAHCSGAMTEEALGVLYHLLAQRLRSDAYIALYFMDHATVAHFLLCLSEAQRWHIHSTTGLLELQFDFSDISFDSSESNTPPPSA